MSLSKIINAPRTVYGEKYEWTELYGDREIREYHNKYESFEVVDLEFQHFGRGGKEFVDFGYGATYREAVEAYEYPDGTIQLCCTIAEWGGTFATHDDIVIRYYLLTPRK